MDERTNGAGQARSTTVAAARGAIGAIRAAGAIGAADSVGAAGAISLAGAIGAARAVGAISLAGAAILLTWAETAHAQNGGAPANPIYIQMIPFVLIILIFYFLILRPQQKRQKAMHKMIEGLRKGDRVLTGGGMYGTIFSIKDDSVLIEVSKDVRVEFSKSAITAIVPGSSE